MSDAIEGLKLVWKEFPVGVSILAIASIGTIIWGIAGVLLLAIHCPPR